MTRRKPSAPKVYPWPLPDAPSEPHRQRLHSADTHVRALEKAASLVAEDAGLDEVLLTIAGCAEDWTEEALPLIGVACRLAVRYMMLSAQDEPDAQVCPSRAQDSVAHEVRALERSVKRVAIGQWGWPAARTLADLGQLFHAIRSEFNIPQL